MNTTSDLGEPDTISDALLGLKTEEQNNILTVQSQHRALLVAELEMKHEALEKQMLHLEHDTRMNVAELERRLRRFKKGVRRVMQELARD